MVERPQPPRDRHEFLRLVKEHHPDRGGDPAALAAVLEAWRRRSAATDGKPVVTAYRKLHGPAAVVALLRAWQQARHRPPRVQ